MKKRKTADMANIKKLLCMTTAALLIALCGCQNKAAEPTEDTQKETLTGIHHAVITVENMGEIALELDADAAPITVTNFIDLAKSGFYDGLTFHRALYGFVIQGGDPNGNGTGGSDKTIKGEFKENGVDNPILHDRGVISMARSKNFDSASSQFFIVQGDDCHASLDGKYAAFGRVTSGMEIVDKIAQSSVTVDNNGSIKSGHKPIITSVKITD